MKDILKLESSDNTLNNVFNEYPFYIDIKGSVSICIIKCAQEIEACNEIKLASMSNNGKYLLLNPSSKTQAKCNIKLAFDSNNDTINDKGEASYKFEKSFITVPSLHRIDGKLFDLETFLIFSSVQKNGNVLYIVLCSLSNGVGNMPTDSSKLVNYKLFDELFTGSNEIPEIHGTKPIGDFPIDLTNFIPSKGNRNFYDYIHPKNSMVNFRIFQSPLDVSNDCLNNLRQKLTPGTIFSDFKLALTQNINPPNNLYFYFSQDLTKNYQSFSENKEDKIISDKFEDLQKTLYKLDNKSNKDNTESENEEGNMEEEHVNNISKLKKIKFDEKDNKEKFINACKKNEDAATNGVIDETKIYKINIKDGSTINVYNNVEDVLKHNNDFKLEDLAEAIDNYPYEQYKGFYWRLNSNIKLYYEEDDELKEYDLKIPPDEQNTLISYLKINSVLKDLTDEEIFNAMKNFPYEKARQYYIQNIYYTKDKDDSNIHPISKIYVIFITWGIIIINFLFYKLVYYFLNDNYNAKLDIDNNDILNNEVLNGLASQRFRVNIMFFITIFLGGIYTLNYSISNNNVDDSNNLLHTILFFSFLISYLIFTYVCNRKTFGNLNYISTSEETSIGLFLSNNIKNDDSTSMTSKIIKYIQNAIKLLLFKNSQNSYNLAYKLNCLFKTTKNTTMSGGYNPSIFTQHSEHNSSIFPQHNEHNPSIFAPNIKNIVYSFLGLPVFPDLEIGASEGPSIKSINDISLDNDYSKYTDIYKSSGYIFKIFIGLGLFHIGNYVLTNKMFNLFDSKSGSKNILSSMNILKIFSLIINIFQIFTSYILMNSNNNGYIYMTILLIIGIIVNSIYKSGWSIGLNLLLFILMIIYICNAKLNFMPKNIFYLLIFISIISLITLMFIIKGSIDYLNPGAVVILIITILIIMYLFVYSIWGKLFPIEHVASLFAPKGTTGTGQDPSSRIASIFGVQNEETPHHNPSIIPTHESITPTSSPTQTQTPIQTPTQTPTQTQTQTINNIIPKLTNNSQQIGQLIQQQNSIKQTKNNLIRIVKKKNKKNKKNKK